MAPDEGRKSFWPLVLNIVDESNVVDGSECKNSMFYGEYSITIQLNPGWGRLQRF